MNIAIIGATGNIGSRVLDEALRRRHEVTAITRDPRKLEPRAGVTVRAGSTSDGPALTRTLKGHDAVIVSVKWNENDIGRVIDVITQIRREALPVRGRRRQPDPQGRPHPFRPHGGKGRAAAYLQARGGGAGGDPQGERPRLDGDLACRLDPARQADRPSSASASISLIEDAEGQSAISREDFAVAILDEIEKPKHIRKRFTAAY